MGEGAAHSIVVESQGFLEAFSPENRDIKIFTIKGICARPRQKAEIDINSFHSKTPLACAYDCPPSASLLETPAKPWMNMGIKIPFININEGQKCNLPSILLI